VNEERLGDHERHQRLSHSDGTSHHESVSEMLIVVLAVGSENDSEKEDGVGEQVDGPTTDGECERDQDQVGETLGEGGHDREVEQVLVVLAFLDDVFILEEGNNGRECRDRALTETGDCMEGQ
jgi:hypothetical protein